MSRERKPFCVRNLIDRQREINSNMGWSAASLQTVRALNKELHEPKVLVLYEMGVYEITINNLSEQNHY